MSLIIRVNQPKPTELSNAAVGDHASGTIADGTYSILAVAWYTDGESDQDNAGYLTTAPSEWENVVVSGKNNTGVITMDIVRPVNSIGKNRYPDHYAFYCQSGSSWTYGDPATKMGEMSSQLTATTLYATGTAGPTFAAAYNSATIGTVYHMPFELREQSVKVYDGSIVRRSHAHINPLDYVTFIFPFMGLVPASTARTQMGDIDKWIVMGTTVRVEDPDTDATIRYYHGMFIYTNYLNTKQKTALDNIEVKMRIETCGLY